MRIKWLRLALLDLDEVAAYIAQDNPTAAVGVVLRIIKAVSLLEDQPGLGRAGRVLGTRELLVPGTPFLVPYRAKDDVIQVLRVFHSSHKWPERI